MRISFFFSQPLFTCPFCSYIARSSAKDHTRHVILGTQSYKPRDFAAQMNFSLSNGWGIVRTVVDLCLKQPEGRYVLVKDPNKVRVASESIWSCEPTTTTDANDLEQLLIFLGDCSPLLGPGRCFQCHRGGRRGGGQQWRRGVEGVRNLLMCDLNQMC